MKREYIVWAALAIVSFLYLRSCNEGVNKGECVVEVRDSIVYLPGKVDTQYFPVPEVEHSNLSFTTELAEVNPNTGLDPSGCDDSIRSHIVPVEDSLISGEIYALTAGNLLDISFNYKPKMIRETFRVDTVKTFKTNEVERKRWSLWVGVDVGGSLTQFNLQPSILIKSKTDLMVGYGYGVVGKTHNFKLYTKIKNPFSR